LTTAGWLLVVRVELCAFHSHISPHLRLEIGALDTYDTPLVSVVRALGAFKCTINGAIAEMRSRGSFKVTKLWHHSSSVVRKQCL
jgi:hypothetical protein